MATSLERLSEIGTKFAQSGTDISDKSDVAEAVAKGAVKGNINVESASGTVVEKVETAVEEETGQEAGELYDPNPNPNPNPNGGNNSNNNNNNNNNNNSNNNSGGSSSSSSSSSNDAPGLVQPPAGSGPTQMPRLEVGQKVEQDQAPVVENPAKPNEDIDMGTTSVESGSSNDGNSNSNNSSDNTSNDILGGIDPKIIAAAVVIAGLAMR